MEQIFIIAATGFYAGMLPFFPGVWGSAAAMLLWYYCRKLPSFFYLGVTAGLFLIGTVAAGQAEELLAEIDASPIVIDEILGIFIALARVSNHKAAWLSCFLVFVILDSLKPFPASWLETNVHGGLGIMLDDVVAGGYTLLIWQFFSYTTSRMDKG